MVRRFDSLATRDTGARESAIPQPPASGFFVRRDAPRALTVDTVDTLAGLRLLREDYEALGATEVVKHPFSRHEWHVTWWRHFAKNSATVRDELAVKVFRREGRVVGIVPWVRTVSPALGPVRMSSLRLLGADPGITELKTVLLAPGEESAVAEALGRALAIDDTWDFVQWSGLDPSSAFFQTLSRALPIEHRPREPDYVLDLPTTWETFRAGLKRNIKESLRHGYNSLAKGGHTFTFEVVSNARGLERALEDFHRLHAARAGLDGTVAHADRFATPESRRFLADVMFRLADRGIARAYVLRVGGQVVAMRLGFVLDETLYLYYSGFDPAWRKYGVMTTALAEILRHAIATGTRTVNLSPGTDVSKTRWSPRTVTFDEGIQVRPALKSRVAYEGYVKAREAKGKGAFSRALRVVRS